MRSVYLRVSPELERYLVAVSEPPSATPFDGEKLWPVAVGAVTGAGAFSVHERHHRRMRDAYSPEAVDRAAILVPRT